MADESGLNQLKERVQPSRSPSPKGTANLSDIREQVQAQDLVFLGALDLPGSIAETDFPRFERWLERGFQGEMRYLERWKDLRRDPSGIVAGARSVVTVGLPYGQGDCLARPDEAPRIAQYARFRDYHKELKKRGTKILNQILDRHPGEVGRVTVDSAPVLERALAAQSGDAFIGKNTCLISPESGSFLLLGEIFLSLSVGSLPALSGNRKGCGPCTECQDRCPTGALDEAYVLDARKCLAYWTIEHRGVVPEAYWPWFRLYYFGCDICQLVCPFNQASSRPKLTASLAVREFPSLYETAVMNQAEYERYFGGTPVTRAGRNGLRRNALIAMTVLDDPMLDSALAQVRHDAPSPIAETLQQIENHRTCL